MKRLLCILLSLLLSALMGAGGSGRTAQRAAYGFRGDETVEKQTLASQGGLTVNATRLSLVSGIPVLDIEAANGTDRALQLLLMENTLNGWTWDANIGLYRQTQGDEAAVIDEGMDFVIPPGETASCGIVFANQYYYEPCGIRAFSEIGLKLEAIDPQTGEQVLSFPPATVKTSVPMSEADGYMEAGSLVCDRDGLRVFAADLRQCEWGGSEVPVCICNGTDRPVNVFAPDVLVNGAKEDAFFGTTVGAGSRCLTSVSIQEEADEVRSLSITLRMEANAADDQGENAGGADAVECMIEFTRE